MSALDMKLSAVFVVFAFFLECSTGLASVDVERPYYSRSEPTVFTTQPKDGVLSGATPINISCEAAVEPIVSGWYPHIYWYHNGSIVNSSHQMTVESNHWNQSHLTTEYPGSYQCVLDDGYFVTVSREAQITLDTTQSNTYTIDLKEGSNNFSRLDVGVYPNKTLKLLCPEMTTPSGIAWFHNGRRINSSKSTISIFVPEGSHTENVIGVYQCFVFNSTHEFSQINKLELSQRPSPPGRVTVQGKPLNFPSLGLVKYQFEWDIDINLQGLKPTFLLEVLQSGNFSNKCKITHQGKGSMLNYVAFFLWPDTVSEFRIVTTTDRDGKCQSDPSLCSPLLSNVGNVTKIPSIYQDATDEVTVNGCENGSCLQDYDYCKLQYDETWTKRFSSSCEVSEGPDLKCTLIWLARESVINPDNTIRVKSNVSCQDELMVNYKKAVSLKNRHGTRYIFTMEVEDIPCNSQCQFSITYSAVRPTEMYNFTSPMIAPKSPVNLEWHWKLDNYSTQAECMDSVMVIVDMGFAHSSCGNPKNFILCANSSNGYDYKCISMNWTSTKLFTNSTKVIHYHLEANWYGLMNNIHKPISIAVVFSNAAGNKSIILGGYLEEEAATLCPPEQTEVPTTEILILLSTTIIGAIFLFIILSFVVVLLLFHMRHRKHQEEIMMKSLQLAAEIVFLDSDDKESDVWDRETECDSIHFSYGGTISSPYIQASVIPGVVPQLQ